MPLSQTSFDLQGLLACARGELFGPGNAKLPMPPMLMLDRILKISDKGGSADKAAFGPSVADFYFTNPIARASAVMAECSAIAHGRTAMTAAE